MTNKRLPRLNAELTGSAKNLIFDDPLVPSDTLPGHHVCERGDFAFEVRLSISGTQQSFGFPQDFQIACRFADMAQLRFKDFIKPSLIKWNYSEEQAKRDTANTDVDGGDLANMLITRIFNHLKNTGKLVHHEWMGETATTAKPLPSKSLRYSNLEQRIVALEQRNAELSQLVGALEQQIEQITKRLP